MEQCIVQSNALCRGFNIFARGRAVAVTGSACLVAYRISPLVGGPQILLTGSGSQY